MTEAERPVLGFLSRWSERKLQTRRGELPPESADASLPEDAATDHQVTREATEPVLTDAARVRSAYRGALNLFLEELRAGCVSAQVDHVLASTAESLDKVLSAYLLARNGGR